MLRPGFLNYLAQKGALRGSIGGGEGVGTDTIDADYDWLALAAQDQASFAEELASYYGCRRVGQEELIGARFLGAELSPRFLRDGHLFPHETSDGQTMLAIATPVDGETVRAVEMALDRPITLAVATANDIDAALSTSVPEQARSVAPTAADEVADATDEELDNLRDLAKGAPVVRELDRLLRLAVEQRATDIHIEPFESNLRVRIRVDGLLKSVAAPPPHMARAVLSRLKIIGGLNITERRLPQDGRASLSVSGAEIDLRIATMPTMHGEGAVIRLLRKNSGLVSFDQLGLSPQGQEAFRKGLQSPFGMIIVTGPTGSGKTTSLAAALAEVNDASRKILTIEDPIEYHIPGINQTQVHPMIGLTFASALRSFLRQDPDVIMVGEMRDSETAHIGVHSALTGHLVLTTLHTNTAAGAVTRLLDMGVESFLLASCARVIIGQRLVRILCDRCKTPRKLGSADFGNNSLFSVLGLNSGETIYEPRGCSWCGFTGYKGRKGVFEVLEVTDGVRQAIGQQTNAIEIERVARSEGMVTMAEDGLAKCRAGQTTAEEVLRVIVSV